MEDLTQINSHYPMLGQVRALYESSFPESERRTWQSVLSLLDGEGEGRYRMYVLHDVSNDEQRLLGMLSLWDFGSWAYIEHFATCADVRGTGVGSYMLGRIIDLTRKTLVLEAEPSGTDRYSDRRIAFYRRHGFEPDVNRQYLQPPYAPGLPWVPLTLMIRPWSGYVVDKHNVDGIADGLYKQVYGIDAT